MGCYIETPRPLDKAAQLQEMHAARVVIDPVGFDLTGPECLICVIENGPFDAAAIAFDERERERFSRGAGGRPVTWLALPRATTIKLCSTREKLVKCLTPERNQTTC